MNRDVSHRLQNLPTIICLCGSTRFKKEFIEANFEFSRAGNIVLSVGWFSHADGESFELRPEEKMRVDILHLRKIDLCDRVHVINVGGYIGESTAREIAYAQSIGKTVTYLEHEAHSGGMKPFKPGPFQRPRSEHVPCPLGREVYLDEEHITRHVSDKSHCLCVLTQNQ